MKKDWFIGFVALLLSQSVLANMAKPGACPSLYAIHEVTFNKVEQIDLMYSYKPKVTNSFHTPETWVLSMPIILAYSDHAALIKANARRLFLNQIIGPYDNGHGRWECRYEGSNSDQDGDRNIAFITTPIIDD